MLTLISLALASKKKYTCTHIVVLDPVNLTLQKLLSTKLTLKLIMTFLNYSYSYVSTISPCALHDACLVYQGYKDSLVRCQQGVHCPKQGLR